MANRNMFEYDIDTDPVAKIFQGLYRLTWIVILPLLLILAIIFGVLWFIGSNITVIDQADTQVIKVEKSAEYQFNYD